MYFVYVVQCTDPHTGGYSVAAGYARGRAKAKGINIVTEWTYVCVSVRVWDEADGNVYTRCGKPETLRGVVVFSKGHVSRSVAPSYSQISPFV